MAESGSQQFHFVLVHGAGHGRWCWYKIQPLLEASGHKVTCIDLKCSGIDLSDFNYVTQFDDYNKPLTSFMDSLQPNEKVILVGHSLSGLNITDVIHKYAEKIDMAIYVAAIMFKNGFFGLKSLLSTDHEEIKRINMEQGAFPWDVYDIIFGLGHNHLPTGIIVKPERQRDTLYTISPIEDSTLASTLLRPTPLLAILNVKFEAGQDADSVPRVYVRTLNDNFMKQSTQDLMILTWPPLKEFQTHSDHSPFFSTPIELFGVLLQAAACIKRD